MRWLRLWRRPVLMDAAKARVRLRRRAMRSGSFDRRHATLGRTDSKASICSMDSVFTVVFIWYRRRGAPCIRRRMSSRGGLRLHCAQDFAQGKRRLGNGRFRLAIGQITNGLDVGFHAVKSQIGCEDSYPDDSTAAFPAHHGATPSNRSNGCHGPMRRIRGQVSFRANQYPAGLPPPRHDFTVCSGFL